MNNRAFHLHEQMKVHRTWMPYFSACGIRITMDRVAMNGQSVTCRRCRATKALRKEVSYVEEAIRLPGVPVRGRLVDARPGDVLLVDDLEEQRT